MQKVIDSIEVSDQAEAAAEGNNRNYQKCYGPLHGLFMHSDDQSSPGRAKRLSNFKAPTAFQKYCSNTYQFPLLGGEESDLRASSELV